MLKIISFLSIIAYEKLGFGLRCLLFAVRCSLSAPYQEYQP
jgi:hypothetical protein